MFVAFDILHQASCRSIPFEGGLVIVEDEWEYRVAEHPLGAWQRTLRAISFFGTIPCGILALQTTRAKRTLGYCC